jgi:exopolysaccharide biosynthesis polyprenyl glycosylphosphotransferase
LPLLTVLNLFARYRLRRHLHELRSAGGCMRRVVVVGHRDGVTDMIRELRRSPSHGLEVVAACLPPGSPGSPDSPVVSEVPVHGGLGDVSLAVARSSADTVAVLSCPELDGVQLRRLAWELEKSGTEFFVAPALLEVAGPRTTIRPVAGFPLLHVDHVEFSGPRRIVKTVFDKTVAALAVVALSPLLGLIALTVRLSSPGPSFFVQRRIGRDGREFPMIKFRTMIVGAEHRKVELARNDSDAVLFKLKSDPRVTRVGSFLRRYSLDELPQLFNVLRGDMSLIGPRPPLREEVDQYGEDVYRRLVVKPGLTGLWQVSGRSDLPWDEAVRLDLQYVENWSLILDMQILWKTIAAVIRGSGAY